MLYPEELEEMGMSISPTGLPYFKDQPMLQSTLCWFSGQKDQEGRPLFEGDICIVGVENEFGSLSEEYATMRWVDDRFILHFQVKKNGGEVYRTRSCVLVGDEFRNPELLSKVNGEKVQN
tara:strand:- start:759 stop:1118 length:360 start_codon:yes stop_codon:yes gene_type:complete